MLLICAVPCWPALTAHAKTSGTLLLTGARTSYSDLTLATGSDVDLANATYTGHGRFVGVYIEAIDKPTADRTQPGTRVGVVWLRDYHGPGDKPVGVELDAGNRHLNPGRYRAYLIADGSSSVRLPITGAASITLKPQTPTSADAVVATNILQNPVEASNRQTLTVRGVRSVDFSSITLGDFRAYAGNVEACLARTGQSCGSATSTGVDGAYTAWFVSPLADTEFGWTVCYSPGVIQPGRNDAVQGALDATTIQFATGAAFTLTLK